MSRTVPGRPCTRFRPAASRNVATFLEHVTLTPRPTRLDERAAAQCVRATYPDPFARDTPERVESTLDNAYANCLAYSSKKGLFPGSYLAVGRTDGFVTVWDVETRNVLRWFGGHVKTVTSVSWSPYNRYLATSSLDWNVHILDLAQGRIVRSLHFDAPVVQVLFAPDTRYASC